MHEAAMQLILDYREAVADVVAQLQQDIGPELLRKGPSGGRFARVGVLSDGSEYKFHGIGCAVTRGDVDVDFDFGVDGRYDGFDWWRLWLFAAQRPQRYPDFVDKQYVRDALERLLNDGLLVVSSSEYGRLLYLPNEPERRI